MSAVFLSETHMNPPGLGATAFNASLGQELEQIGHTTREGTLTNWSTHLGEQHGTQHNILLGGGDGLTHLPAWCCYGMVPRMTQGHYLQLHSMA